MLESKSHVANQISMCFGKVKTKNLITHIELLNTPAFNAKYPNWAKELYEIDAWPSFHNYNMSLRYNDIRPFYSDELAGDRLIPLRNTRKSTLFFKWALASLWICNVYWILMVALILKLWYAVIIYTLTCLIKACVIEITGTKIYAIHTSPKTKILLSCASGVPP
ncbi:MAG: hypothetical protein ACOYJB_06170 [Christensenellaceae bacterium]|jgi:hypothetical protein